MKPGGNLNKALILYAMTGKVEDLKRVIKEGADLNAGTVEGHTALIANHRSEFQKPA